MTPSTAEFARPHLRWFALLDGGVLALTVLSTSRAAYETARARAPMPPRRALQALLVGTLVVHVTEATYAYRSARRHGLAAAAPRWAGQTFVVGFPSLLKLREVAAAHHRAPGSPPTAE